MTGLTTPQARLLIQAATHGLRRNPPGKGGSTPYSRTCINALIQRGYIGHDWQITERGRQWVEQHTMEKAC